MDVIFKEERDNDNEMREKREREEPDRLERTTKAPPALSHAQSHAASGSGTARGAELKSGT